MRVVYLLLLLIACAGAHADPATDARLRSFFDAEWERGLRESPERATYQGDTRYNDRWSDNSAAAIARSQQAERDALKVLQSFDRAALSPDSQLDYDTFRWLLDSRITEQRFRPELQPVGHRGGVHTLDEMTEVLRFNTRKDYADWLARMDAVPTVIEQTTALMREGMRTGYMPPRVVMQRVPAQIRARIVDDATKSRFYAPFAKMHASIPVAEQTAMQARARSLVADRIVPAYRAFETFFNTEYLPATRTGIAASELPDGRAYYDFLARRFTTTDMGADAIHALGLKEVARLRVAMETVKDEVGFKGTLAQFFDHLRTDPKYFYPTPEALLDGYRAISKRIDPELVKVSARIPRLPYGVRAIPAEAAPDTTTAYYQSGAADGTRAGYYYVNLYKPETRPRWEMMPLSLHEAVPGHHFQFARGLELDNRPMFRKTGYFTAYGEGWGLYAEQLGYEMGLYDDPYDRFGQLTYEMWRAVRLVVDTGMHAKGWSRERAITYFKDNAAKTEQDIVNEIDRYIDNPGQALAYKVGQLRISAMRARAKAALGDRFDLRAFNDAVLETGSIPLDALEARIDSWIAGQGGAATTSSR